MIVPTAFKVGPLRSSIEGCAFVVTDEQERPLVTFEYPTIGKARDATAALEAALKECVKIRPHR